MFSRGVKPSQTLLCYGLKKLIFEDNLFLRSRHKMLVYTGFHKCTETRYFIKVTYRASHRYYDKLDKRDPEYHFKVIGSWTLNFTKRCG